MEVDISKLAMTSDYGLRLFMPDLKTRSFGEDTWVISWRHMGYHGRSDGNKKHCEKLKFAVVRIYNILYNG